MSAATTTTTKRKEVKLPDLTKANTACRAYAYALSNALHLDPQIVFPFLAIKCDSKAANQHFAEILKRYSDPMSDYYRSMILQFTQYALNAENSLNAEKSKKTKSLLPTLMKLHSHCRSFAYAFICHCNDHGANLSLNAVFKVMGIQLSSNDAKAHYSHWIELYTSPLNDECVLMTRSFLRYALGQNDVAFGQNDVAYNQHDVTFGQNQVAYNQNDVAYNQNTVTLEDAVAKVFQEMTPAIQHPFQEEVGSLLEGQQSDDDDQIEDAGEDDPNDVICIDDEETLALPAYSKSKLNRILCDSSLQSECRRLAEAYLQQKDLLLIGARLMAEIKPTSVSFLSASSITIKEEPLDTLATQCALAETAFVEEEDDDRPSLFDQFDMEPSASPLKKQRTFEALGESRVVSAFCASFATSSIYCRGTSFRSDTLEC
jgi:hypothetical protein